MAERAPALRAEALRRSFGGVVALDLDELEVEAGSALGVIGPNGAGKTSLLDVVSGFVPAEAGRWWVGGREVTGRRPERIARTGLVRTFQRARPFGRLTVLENVLAAAAGRAPERPWGAVAGRRSARRRAAAMDAARDQLAWCGLAAVADRPAGELSVGQQKLLDLARALVADPQVLLLDEPMAGVAPATRDEVAERLASVRDRGVALLVVEHDLRLVRVLCSRAICLDRGRAIAHGPPEAVLRADAVVDAYLGVRSDVS